MKIKNLLPALLLLSVSIGASAQAKKYTKLEIKAKEVFEVGPGNTLLVDTLIMHDKATIKFTPESKGILQANVAIVGKKCTITSRGENGLHSDSKALGTAGQDGGDLDITIHFDQLKSLTIDTRGGRGGNGGRFIDTRGEIFSVREVKLSDGKTAKEIIPTPIGFGIPKTGYTGTDATTGFNGGNGGNINFTYSSKSFIPLINNPKVKNKITLLHAAGEQGRHGVTSKDGKLVDINTQEPIDGEIRLTNANNETEQN